MKSVKTLSRESGFSLIEAMVLTLVLAVLASTAFPKFTSVEYENDLMNVRLLAEQMEYAASLNHAVDVAVESGLTSLEQDPFVNVSSCIDAVGLLLDQTLPLGYTIAANGKITDHETRECILSGTHGVSAKFTVIGASGGVN